MLSTIMLLTTFIGKLPAMRNRMPPPSSFARFASTRLPVMSTEPLPGESAAVFGGSSPATMMPPPSS